MLITLTLTGCATTMGIVGIDDLCDRNNPDEGLIRPFYWSSQDTDVSIGQAKERNAEYERLCLGKGQDSWTQRLSSLGFLPKAPPE